MTFIHRTYQAKAPGRGFQPNWHTVAMAHHLMECLEGRCRRLIITVPPRSRKSIACSVDHPAFTLGRDPTQRVIYAQDLAVKHARDCRAVMESDWSTAIATTLLIR
jgi:hypothetical protein